MHVRTYVRITGTSAARGSQPWREVTHVVQAHEAFASPLALEVLHRAVNALDTHKMLDMHLSLEIVQIAVEHHATHMTLASPLALEVLYRSVCVPSTVLDTHKVLGIHLSLVVKGGTIIAHLSQARIHHASANQIQLAGFIILHNEKESDIAYGSMLCFVFSASIHDGGFTSAG